MLSRCLIVALVLVAPGCATYEGQLRSVHEAFYSGQVAEAERGLRELIEDSPPEDKTLLELELAAVLHAQGSYAAAAELLVAADERLEVLDYSSAPIEVVAEFAFAIDDVWRASPPERAMINTQNMINYLGAGELEEAAVEARRLMILLSQADLAEDERYGSDFGRGLAGVILAANGNREEASDVFAELPPESGLRPPQDLADRGTILVLCQLGRAPIRRQGHYWITSGGVPHQLNIPVMQRRPGGASAASVTLNGESQGTVPMLFDLGEQLMKLYKKEFPRLIAAAVTQAVPRAIGAKLVGKAAEEAMSSEDDNSAEEATAALVGSLVAFMTESAMALIQVADVRCWSLLPGKFAAMRLDVAPGSHQLTVALTDGRAPLQLSVVVSPGELLLVNVVSAMGGGLPSYPEPRGGDLTYQPAGLKALALLEEASWLHSELD
ncbi:MAG: hypothetical protein ACI9EF_001688 [Pseudohongiellaceae bacterium]